MLEEQGGAKAYLGRESFFVGARDGTKRGKEGGKVGSVGGAQRKRGEPSSSSSSSFMPGRIFGGRTSLDVSPLLALSPTSKQGITRWTEGGEKSTIQSV